MGKPRLYLKDPITGQLSEDADVLAAASAPCYAWDGGQALPANLNVLLYGSPSPTDFSADKHLSTVESLQHVYRFLVPEDLQSRLASRPSKYGGPVNITKDQAEMALKEYKKAFEETYAADWD